MPYGVWGNPMGLIGVLGKPYRVWEDPMGVNGAVGGPLGALWGLGESYGGQRGSGRTSG